MDRPKEAEKKESGQRGKGKNSRAKSGTAGKKKLPSKRKYRRRFAFWLAIFFLWSMLSGREEDGGGRGKEVDTCESEEEQCGAVLSEEKSSHIFLRAEAATVPVGCSEKTFRPSVPLTFPLQTDDWYISSGYGWRKHPITKQRRFHQGEDIACAEGSKVCAALDGIVSVARYSKSYGNYIRIRHSDGVETLYAHMKCLFVRSGELVHSGQILGLAGQTGEATGPHLHFELFSDTVRYDPSEALGL